MDQQHTDSLWAEIAQATATAADLQERYGTLYDVLDRTCTELVAPLTAHYNGLFTRLQVLCRMNGLPLHEADDFRYRAQQVRRGRLTPDAATTDADTGTVVRTLARLLHCEVPETLQRYARLQSAPHRTDDRAAADEPTGRRLRLVAERREDATIMARRTDGAPGLLRVDCTASDHTRRSAGMIGADVQFNIVDYTTDPVTAALRPQLIIVEPDYLVDVSSLTACIQPYGDTPYNFLLRQFGSSDTSAAILLGGIAGRFLDDLVHSAAPTFAASINKAFHENVLDFCATEGIDAAFFDECRRQWAHIARTLADIHVTGGGCGGCGTDNSKGGTDIHAGGGSGRRGYVLEPTFFCETLGLQGRFDLMADDHTMVLELKSGKWDEFRSTVPRSHLLQMLLYKEILHYNIGVPRSRVSGYLFYSKYPYLLEQRSARVIVEDVLTLRNRIVRMERALAEGQGRDALMRLRPEHFLTAEHVSPRFWDDHIKPKIEAFLTPLHAADALTQDYFFTFMQFVAREHWLAKVGDSRVDSTRGMACLWNADEALKRQNGDLLTGLRLTDKRTDADGAIEALCLRLDTAADEGGDKADIEGDMADEGCDTPNFRVGDAVILYARTRREDNATNRQVIRCGVERYTADSIWLRLRYAQHLTWLADVNVRTRYAVEHDTMESSFRTLYAGLASLLTAPRSRRELLLCQREASSADFQLIVGPPGTGKTSVTMRRLVTEGHGKGLTQMLAAYTNRAVDEICAMLEAAGLDYVRVGKELSADEQFHPHLIGRKTAAATSRGQVLEMLAAEDIFVGTVSALSAATSLCKIRRFDVAIFDEASQILEHQLLTLLCAADAQGRPAIGRFVMIGDHKQLPAVVVQDERLSAVAAPRLRAIGLTDCRNSLFERLHRAVAGREDMVRMLDHQGRMHEDIGRLASEMFYDGCLRPVPLPHQTGAVPFAVCDDADADVAHCRLGFVDVPPDDRGAFRPKMNHNEAAVIAALTAVIERLLVRNGAAGSLADHVGIIVPFRRQIACVRQELHRRHVGDADRVLIDTVERYQGSQKDVVIYGTTVARPYELDLLSVAHEVDGVEVDRKLNVALTRARCQFFLVGNGTLLRRNGFFRRLIVSSLALRAENCGAAKFFFRCGAESDLPQTGVEPAAK